MTKPELINTISAALPKGLTVVEESTMAELENVQAFVGSKNHDDLQNALNKANEDLTEAKKLIAEREDDLIKLNEVLSKQATEKNKSRTVILNTGTYLINHGINMPSEEGLKTYTVEDLLKEENTSVVEALAEQGSSAVTKQ
jgi:hypothetical protein